MVLKAKNQNSVTLGQLIGLISPMLRDRKLGISLVKTLLISLATSALVAGTATAHGTIFGVCENEFQDWEDYLNMYGSSDWRTINAKGSYDSCEKKVIMEHRRCGKDHKYNEYSLFHSKKGKELGASGKTFKCEAHEGYAPD